MLLLQANSAKPTDVIFAAFPRNAVRNATCFVDLHDFFWRMHVVFGQVQNVDAGAFVLLDFQRRPFFVTVVAYNSQNRDKRSGMIHSMGRHFGRDHWPW